MVTNKQIEAFLDHISTIDKYYATDNDKAFLSNYDAYDDYVLKKDTIDSVWAFLSRKFSGLQKISFNLNPVTVFHTNAGTGKSLYYCPSKNISIKALNSQFILKKISDLLNQGSTLNFSYDSSISDISHYFINGDNGNTKRYDIVFTQPSRTEYYKGIDNTSISNLSYIEYYSVRSLDFLAKGGYLCIFTHPAKFMAIRGNKTIRNSCDVVEIINPTNHQECGCLILKKK